MIYLSLAGGVLFLYLGAEGLIRGGASLALRLGLTPLLVGLTVVAFGTSMPEMVVSVGAALENLGDIAVGNAVGSNIANVLLILGVAAVIRPLRVRSQLVRLDVPLVIGVSLLVTFLLLNDRALGRVEGAFLVLGLAAYTVMSIVVARREQALVMAEFVGELPPL